MAQRDLSFEMLSFARPYVNYPGGLPAELVEAGVVRLPDDGDTGLNEYLLGQSYFPEAFLTEEARNARLGPVHANIAFVPMTRTQAKASGASPHNLAIGPALSDEGFEAIAELVIPGKVEQLYKFASGGSRSSISVIIARVEYELRRNADGSLMVAACPLYSAWPGQPEIDETISWMLQTFATHLCVPPMPPVPPSPATRDLRRSA